MILITFISLFMKTISIEIYFFTILFLYLLHNKIKILLEIINNLKTL